MTRADGGGRVAVVTGGARGIGRAISLRLARRGYCVIAADRSPIHDDDAFTAALSEGGGSVEPMLLDVADPAQIHDVARRLRDRFGRLDALVNNAGIFEKTPAFRPKLESIERTLNINLKGALLCTSAFVESMIRGRGGRIINIASVSAVSGAAMAAAYAASKAGIVAMTQSHARELAGHGISVNAVLPGCCETEMSAGERAALDKFVVPRIPMKRLGSPDEVAEVVEFLATCQTTYLTGSTIVIDGGIHVG
jgi:3-oxoacyl-[acyl-carrier protein] reductase